MTSTFSIHQEITEWGGRGVLAHCPLFVVIHPRKLSSSLGLGRGGAGNFVLAVCMRCGGRMPVVVNVGRNQWYVGMSKT